MFWRSVEASRQFFRWTGIIHTHAVRFRLRTSLRCSAALQPQWHTLYTFLGARRRGSGKDDSNRESARNENASRATGCCLQRFELQL